MQIGTKKEKANNRTKAKDLAERQLTKVNFFINKIHYGI